MPAIHRIVVASDFSEDAANALAYAQELARKFDSELIVVHVNETLTAFYGGPEFGAGYSPPLIEAAARFAEEQKAASRRELSETLERLGREGFKARGIIRSGAPFYEIVETAKAENADLIVMGTHGRSGIAHLLIGSVAERVVRKAECPVLTVRHPSRKASQ